MSQIHQKNQIIFFNEPKISKSFIASILRASDAEGEDILLEELKNNKNFEVRRAIANALSYRILKNPNYLEIRLDKNDTNSVCNNLPGSFCKYIGNISPIIEMNNKDIDQLLEQEELNEENEVEIAACGERKNACEQNSFLCKTGGFKNKQ